MKPVRRAFGVIDEDDNVLAAWDYYTEVEDVFCYPSFEFKQVLADADELAEDHGINEWTYAKLLFDEGGKFGEIMSDEYWGNYCSTDADIACPQSVILIVLCKQCWRMAFLRKFSKKT